MCSAFSLIAKFPIPEFDSSMEKDQLLYLIYLVLNEFMAQSLLERQFRTLKINVVWLNEFIYTKTQTFEHVTISKHMITFVFVADVLVFVSE